MIVVEGICCVLWVFGGSESCSGGGSCSGKYLLQLFVMFVGVWWCWVIGEVGGIFYVLDFDFWIFFGSSLFLVCGYVFVFIWFFQYWYLLGSGNGCGFTGFGGAVVVVFGGCWVASRREWERRRQREREKIQRGRLINEWINE